MLNWSLNNYIGLANHPEVRKADAEAAAEYGMAYPMGARMMSGQTNKHEELEEELAKFAKDGVTAEELEDDLLDKAWGLCPQSRLSCQAFVAQTDLVIEIPKYTVNHAKEGH